MKHTIGIVGLGLIGGSMAKAFKREGSHTVYGFDADAATLASALADGVVERALDGGNIGECDFLVVALYPAATAAYVKENLPRIRRGAVVVDCAGIKRGICGELSQLCAGQGVYFVGGHPMAGLERSGYAYSSAGLFDKASMILCTDGHTNAVALKALERLFLSVGFGVVTVCGAAEHDKMIAFTSQLAHIISGAYVRGPEAGRHAGYSAGSFADMTRVARMHAPMWSELFLGNADYLIDEIEGLRARLGEYSDALARGDAGELLRLIEEGNRVRDSL